MKYLFLTLGVMNFSLTVFSQNLKSDTVYNHVDILMDVDIKPRFPGCEGAGSISEKTICSETKMTDYIYHNLIYPSSAKENGISGTVVLNFTVLKNGVIDNVEVVREPGGGLAQAAIDVVKGMNNLNEKWIPAMKDDKPVSAWYTLPIKFRLYNKVGSQNEKAVMNYSFKDSYPIDNILCLGYQCVTPEIKESFSHYYSVESISGKAYFRVSRNNSAKYSSDPIVSRSRLTWPVEAIEISLLNGHVINSSLEASEKFYRKILGQVEFTDYYFPIQDSDLKTIMSYPIKKLEFGYYKNKEKLKSANSWTPDKKEAVKISKWVREMLNKTN